MHKIFGEKEDAKYFDRKGAYIVPIRGDEVAVVETPKGVFVLGGGIEANETDAQCICRECLEEVGCEVEIHELICTAETYTKHPEVGYFHPIQAYYSGVLGEKIMEPIEKNHELTWINISEVKTKMYSKMQAWAIEQVFCNRDCNS